MRASIAAVLLAAACAPVQSASSPSPEPPASADASSESSTQAPTEGMDPGSTETASAPQGDPEADPKPDPEPLEAASRESADPLSPLDAEQQRAFEAGDEDPEGTFDKHYVKSNESRHDVWFPTLDGLGGAYVGVGADQNYTLIARARASLVFLLDIDPRVVEIHRNYEALIEASEGPAALLSRFEPEGQEESLRIIDAHHAQADEDTRRAQRQAYRATRETLRRHLAKVAARTADGQPSSWLSDPEAYAWIRRLYLADRVRIMPGDLTGETSMATIAEAARGVGTPVRVLYLSNAEEYFRYVSGRFRANVQGLPKDARSVVLRTIYGDDFEHADSLWNYQVQSLSDFSRRLARDELRSRNRMLSDAERSGALEREADGTHGLSRLGSAPVGGD